MAERRADARYRPVSTSSTRAWEANASRSGSSACLDRFSNREETTMKRAGFLLAVMLACATEARALEVLRTETVTLKNGLRLVLAPDPKAHSVDLTVWYDAGSRYDAPTRTGVAHLFEHLMFRGSTHFGPDEHSRLVRNEGGTSGAYAAHDFIAFYETLPPDALELGLRLEADRMTGLNL